MSTTFPLDSAGEALRYGDIPGTTFSPGRALAASFSFLIARPFVLSHALFVLLFALLQFALALLHSLKVLLVALPRRLSGFLAGLRQVDLAQLESCVDVGHPCGVLVVYLLCGERQDGLRPAMKGWVATFPPVTFAVAAWSAMRWLEAALV